MEAISSRTAVNGGVSRSQPVVALSVRASRRAASRTCWTKAVMSGACAAASSSEPITYTVPPDRTNVSGSNPALFGVGEGAVGDVGVGEAGDGVAEGLPDPGPGLLHHGLGLLQGAADGGQSGMAAEDVGGFGVGVVLAPGRRTRDRRAGQAGGEQVGGEDVDGAAFEERDGSPPRRAVAVAGWWRGARAWARRFAALTVAQPRIGDHRTRRGQSAAPVRSSTCDGGAGAFPGGGGEEEQVELGGGDDQPGRGVEDFVDQVHQRFAGLLRGDHSGRVLQRQPQVLAGDRRPVQRDADLTQRGAGAGPGGSGPAGSPWRGVGTRSGTAPGRHRPGSRTRSRSARSAGRTSGPTRCPPQGLRCRAGS